MRRAVLVIPLLVLVGAVVALMNRDTIERFFGPPEVRMREDYPGEGIGPDVDHSRLAGVLERFVNEEGLVDYEGLHADQEDLNEYVLSLAHAPFDALGRDQKLALLLNAYNAFVLRLVLDHWQEGRLRSIQDIPEAERFQAVRWSVGGHDWSLETMEHEIIRRRFIEPRVHFALVCAARSCPPLRREPYQASRLDEQLEDQARRVHSSPRWFRLDEERGEVHLTRLYLWYQGDFEQVAGGVLPFAARYSSSLRRLLDQGHEPAIRWLPYDWSLNRQ